MPNQDCLFCKIIQGQESAYKVYEDDKVFAFLDIYPANPGHTLVIPKKHFEQITDLSQEYLHALADATQKISQTLKTAFDAPGIDILSNNGSEANQIIPHFHFHLIPRHKNDQVGLSASREKGTSDQLKQAQKKIKLNI